MLSAEERKGKRYFKMHNSVTHSTNECMVFKQQIQQAIRLGKLSFDTTSKMKVDENPFPTAAMAGVVLPKGKARVLTSERAKQSGSVDHSLQITAEEYREFKRDHKNSRSDKPESSQSAEARPRINLASFSTNGKDNKKKTSEEG